MKGDSMVNSPGHYGIQGVFDSLNSPIGFYEACEWTDLNGNFWLFGGQNHGHQYNDLWEFKPSINQWAWIKGPGIVDQFGIYGTQNIPSQTNNPGVRGFGVSTWVDTAGNLWLFGGYGYSINALGDLNDLWMYNINTNEWTWVAGPNVINDTGNYGTYRVSSSLNCPPSRHETNASWIDNYSNLWLFGGFNQTSGNFSDLWKYDVSINQWAWMKGPSITNQPSVYGIKGISDSTNIPSARQCYSKWKDLNGNFWMFGGHVTGICNDLWKYNPSINEWVWMSGTNLFNDVGTFGTQCIGDTLNIPPSRCENRAAWTLPCDNFVCFGGKDAGSQNSYNDLWNYNVLSNQWTWMSGNTIPNQLGNYGTITVSNSLNSPPSRFGSLGWKDNFGNLWMFGGLRWGGNYYNDLWRFIPDTTCIHINTTRSSFNTQFISGCAPLTVVFNNTSVNGSSFLWNFGDGNTSTSYSPTYIYYSSGIFNVSLIAISACGGASDTSFLTITVNQFYNQTFSDTICQGDIFFFPDGTMITGLEDTIQTSHFISMSSCDSNIITALTVNPTYSQTLTASICQGNIFTFPDGSTSTVDTIEISHFSTINSCDSNIVTTLSVYPLPNPIITANAPTTFCQGDSVSLNVGNYSFYNWSNSSTTQSITVSSSGTYAVIITDSNGCTGTALQNIFVISYDSANSAFTVDTIDGCKPLLVHFTNLSTNANSFYWTFGDGGTSTLINPTHYYNNTGNYTVTLIGYDTTICGIFNDTSFQTYHFTVFNPPVSPIITQHGDTLISSFMDGNQWYDDTTLIIGATNQNYIVLVNGCYDVVEIDSNGCKSRSDTVCFTTGVNEITNNHGVTIYPNPTSGTFTLSYNSKLPILNSQFKIYDVLGQEVYSQAITIPNQTTINVSQLNNGVYFYQLTNNIETYRGKFVKE